MDEILKLADPVVFLHNLRTKGRKLLQDDAIVGAVSAFHAFVHLFVNRSWFIICLLSLTDFD